MNVFSGKNITVTDAEEIKYTLREQQYITAIQKAYSFASKSLLELLMKEYDLMGRLKSVKHYFLMDQGDFIVQFMDASEQELDKNIDDIMPTRLESLLGLCLRLLSLQLLIIIFIIISNFIFLCYFVQTLGC